MTKTKTIQRPNARRNHIISEALGWYGAAAILIAYGLSSFNVLSVQSTLYLILNLTGALGILAVATAKHVRQSMLINAFWALMAAVSLIRIMLGA